MSVWTRKVLLLTLALGGLGCRPHWTAELGELEDRIAAVEGDIARARQLEPRRAELQAEVRELGGNLSELDRILPPNLPAALEQLERDLAGVGLEDVVLVSHEAHEREHHELVAVGLSARLPEGSIARMADELSLRPMLIRIADVEAQRPDGSGPVQLDLVVEVFVAKGEP